MPDAPAPEPPAPLVWIDMEMSGLDPPTCAILEIAVLVTNADLQVIAEGPDIVVHQPGAVLEEMDDWNKTHHGESGLSDRVRASPISLAEAEEQVLGFLGQHCEEGASPLCGNSVHMDRAFLAAHMPRLHAFVHYRNVDVSTVKELVRRWYPGVPISQKREAHRAMSDIIESIEELRYYRENVFRDPASTEIQPPAGTV